MTGNPPAPFDSLADLQRAHTALAQSALAELLAGDNPGAVVEFVRRAVATGRLLDAKDDRAAAQALINFWSSRLSSAVREQARAVTAGAGTAESVRAGAASSTATSGPDLGDTLLSEFDRVTLQAVGKAAEAWVGGLSPTDRAIARGVMLRLVRLDAAGNRFEPVPTARAGLYDYAAPTDVGRVLDELVKVGAVRVTPSPEGVPEMDRVGLRSPDLMAAWPSFAGWLQERARFREQVAAWDQVGRRGAGRLTEAEWDDARLFHDRDATERAYLDACRERDRRRRELVRGGAVLLGVLLLVIVPLTVVSWVGWTRAEVEKDRANVEKDRAKESATAATEAKKESDRHAADAERARAAVGRQHRFARTVQVIRTLAEVGAARTDAEFEVALKRWETLSGQVRAEEAQRPGERTYFTAFFDARFPPGPGRDGLEQAARAAKVAADRAAGKPVRRLKDDHAVNSQWYTTTEWQGFNGQILGVARGFRNDLLGENDDEVNRQLREIRAASYDRVLYCVEKMLSVFEDRSFDDAAPLVREFWLNYWGDLGFVEGTEVARRMAEFGTPLRRIEERLPAFAAADGGYSYNRNVKERHLKMPGINVREINRLGKEYSRMVFKDELAELTKLAGPLYDALAKDKNAPLLPHGKTE